MPDLVAFEVAAGNDVAGWSQGGTNRCWRTGQVEPAWGGPGGVTGCAGLEFVLTGQKRYGRPLAGGVGGQLFMGVGSGEGDNRAGDRLTAGAKRQPAYGRSSDDLSA